MPSWETWHKRYGYISYTGLQKIYQLGLVDGFDVDVCTPKPDCVMCIEGKLTIKPFEKSATHVQECYRLGKWLNCQGVAVVQSGSVTPMMHVLFMSPVSVKALEPIPLLSLYVPIGVASSKTS